MTVGSRMWVKSQYNTHVDEYTLKYSIAIEHITRNKHYVSIQGSNIQSPPHTHTHKNIKMYTHTHTHIHHESIHEV
jgi:hypothetical protein